jgi:hypothetical protein
MTTDMVIGMALGGMWVYLLVGAVKSWKSLQRSRPWRQPDWGWKDKVWLAGGVAVGMLLWPVWRPQWKVASAAEHRLRETLDRTRGKTDV